jgi:hypothetical protein
MVSEIEERQGKVVGGGKASKLRRAMKWEEQPLVKAKVKTGTKMGSKRS